MNEEKRNLKSSGYKTKAGEDGINRDRIIVRSGINHFPNRLKEAMEGMSNSEVARRAYMSEATVRKYINGVTYPAIDSAALIAHACNVPLPWLITGREQKDETGGDVVCSGGSTISSSPTMLSILLERLRDDEKEELTDLLIREGVKTLLTLVDEDTLNLVKLPREEKKRLLALHEAKKGAPESCVENNFATPSQQKLG